MHVYNALSSSAQRLCSNDDVDKSLRSKLQSLDGSEHVIVRRSCELVRMPSLQDGSGHAVRGAKQAVRQGLHQTREEMHKAR
ncbi:hypothetical protein DPX16_13855 [Anabarilius grahami]|uniref:Uncharacterized protein n=1 Tax=Anabarilius grahami TaxID=495550 RepID=A0A3N0XVT4_ANAGA|nr:hypothetical protein DPX16_13855 [Anabarilius grahami]